MQSNIILYTTDSGSISVQVQYEDGTFWLTQKRMADLFGVEVPTINYHLKEVFKTGELNEDSVIRKIRITADDGKNYLTNSTTSNCIARTPSPDCHSSARGCR